MSEVVFGRDMVLQCKVDGVYTAIGCATGCSFEFENELIGKTDVNAGLFRKKRVRMSDCRASAQGLTTLINNSTLSVMYFLQESIRRAELDLRFIFTDQGGNFKQVQGIFLVSGVGITGDVPNFSEMDLSFEGTGGISISSVDSEDESGTSGIPGDVMWDWWDTVEGETTITGPGHYGRSFAGHEVLEVDREGIEHDLDIPNNRKYSYDGTTISFDEFLPFNDGERVFVLWQPDES